MISLRTTKTWPDRTDGLSRNVNVPASVATGVQHLTIGVQDLDIVHQKPIVVDHGSGMTGRGRHHRSRVGDYGRRRAIDVAEQSFADRRV
jgi:hypothetical protein